MKNWAAATRRRVLLVFAILHIAASHVLNATTDTHARRPPHSTAYAAASRRVVVVDAAATLLMALGRPARPAPHSHASTSIIRIITASAHNDFLWAKILLLHAENLFIDFGAES